MGAGYCWSIPHHCGGRRLFCPGGSIWGIGLDPGGSRRSNWLRFSETARCRSIGDEFVVGRDPLASYKRVVIIG